MVTIQTTAHVGPDGVLRLEAPVALKDQDVQVVLVIEPQPAKAAPAAPAAAAEDDPWRDLRAKLTGTEGITLPPPGRRVYRPVEPVDLPGPSASEILIRDRR